MCFNHQATLAPGKRSWHWQDNVPQCQNLRNNWRSSCRCPRARPAVSFQQIWPFNAIATLGKYGKSTQISDNSRTNQNKLQMATFISPKMDRFCGGFKTQKASIMIGPIVQAWKKAKIPWRLPGHSTVIMPIIPTLCKRLTVIPKDIPVVAITLTTPVQLAIILLHWKTHTNTNVQITTWKKTAYSQIW